MNWLARLFCRRKNVEIAVLKRSLDDMHSRVNEAIADRNREMARATELVERVAELELKLNKPVETPESKREIEARLHIADLRAAHREMKGGE